MGKRINIIFVKSSKVTSVSVIVQFIMITSGEDKVINVKKSGLIYILMWTPADKEPFNYLELGQEAFRKRNCSFQNCFLTNDRLYFNNTLYYDVILFNAWHLNTGPTEDIPANRSESQEYFLVGQESAALYPIPPNYNNFFNMTWTYKLSSDVVHSYITVKNSRGETIGPKIDMKWEEQMGSTDASIIAKVSNKSVAAAWIASNCANGGHRYYFTKNLQYHLRKYGHRVDIYGKCGDGDYFCPEGERMDECFGAIESDYYFYLAFENSFADDYVTEKLLHALEHFAVPIVYGAANYTRFMPNGIYINAYDLGASELAKEMNDIINNPARYFDFFKWHGHYSFHNPTEDHYRDTICALCAILNNKTRTSQKTVYKRITKWWNGYERDYPFFYPPEFVPEEKYAGTGVVGFFKNLYDYFFVDL